MLSIKYSPKEILCETKFRKEIHNFVAERMLFLSEISANRYILLLNEHLQPNMPASSSSANKSKNNNNNQPPPLSAF